MEKTDGRTMKDLAQGSLFVQDACNLTGIVHGFSRTMTRLRELEPDKGTEFYNKHPIAVLFADKISSLAGTQSGMVAFSKAYDWAKDLVGNEHIGGE